MRAEETLARDESRVKPRATEPVRFAHAASFHEWTLNGVGSTRERRSARQDGPSTKNARA